MVKPISNCKNFFISHEAQKLTKKGIATTITEIALGAIGLAIGTLALLTILQKLPQGNIFFSSIGTLGFKGSIALVAGGGALLSIGLITALVLACRKKQHGTVTSKDSSEEIIPNNFPFYEGKTGHAISLIVTCFLKPNEIFAFRTEENSKKIGVIVHSCENRENERFAMACNIAELDTLCKLSSNVPFEEIEKRINAAAHSVHHLASGLNPNEGQYHKSKQLFTVYVQDANNIPFGNISYMPCPLIYSQEVIKKYREDGWTITELD